MYYDFVEKLTLLDIYQNLFTCNRLISCCGTDGVPNPT